MKSGAIARGVFESLEHLTARFGIADAAKHSSKLEMHCGGVGWSEFEQGAVSTDGGLSLGGLLAGLGEEAIGLRDQRIDACTLPRSRTVVTPRSR